MSSSARIEITLVIITPRPWNLRRNSSISHLFTSCSRFSQDHIFCAMTVKISTNFVDGHNTPLTLPIMLPYSHCYIATLLLLLCYTDARVHCYSFTTSHGHSYSFATALAYLYSFAIPLAHSNSFAASLVLSYSFATSLVHSYSVDTALILQLLYYFYGTLLLIDTPLVHSYSFDTSLDLRLLLCYLASTLATPLLLRWYSCYSFATPLVLLLLW